MAIRYRRHDDSDILKLAQRARGQICVPKLTHQGAVRDRGKGKVWYLRTIARCSCTDVDLVKWGLRNSRSLGSEFLIKIQRGHQILWLTLWFYKVLRCETVLVGNHMTLTGSKQGPIIHTVRKHPQPLQGNYRQPTLSMTRNDIKRQIYPLCRRRRQPIPRARCATTR